MTRTHKGLVRLVAVLASLTLVAAACSDDDGGVVAGEGTTTTEATSVEAGASVDGELVLSAIFPLTGDLAAYGPGITAAVELAVEDANAAGGVLGKPVKLTSYDSATDPAVAKTATEKAVNTDKADAILGAAGSSVVIGGVFDVAIGAGRIECSPSSTSPILTAKEDNGLFFRTVPSDVLQAQLLAQKITGANIESAVIVYRDDDYGTAFAGELEAVLEDAGIDVKESIALDPDKDADAVVEQAKATEAGAVIPILFPEEGAGFFTTAIEKGFGPDDVPYFITDGLATQDDPETDEQEGLAASIDPNNAGVIDAVKGTRPGSGGGDTADFDARMTSEKSVSEVTFAAQAYDCATLIMLTAESLGTDDPLKIAAAMVENTRGGDKCTDFASCKALLDAGTTDIDFDGITGFDMNDIGELSSGFYEFFHFEDGAIVTDEVSLIEG